ncbi:MAG: YraN family protein [Syntrophomonadaceae bacterium]|nr:YraN family protein [Syntrophomonadaceae bacterium]
MRKALGKWGEDIAADYLRQRGYRIITRNFRTRAGEIDIVCRRGRLLVFVEVKTRNGTAYGSPEESITLAKQRQIRQLALAYLENNKPNFGEVRFDVIGILISDGRPQINHLEAAF